MNPIPGGYAGPWRPVEYRCVTSLGEIKAGVMAAQGHALSNPEYRLAEVTVARVEDDWDDLDPKNDLLDYWGGCD